MNLTRFAVISLLLAGLTCYLGYGVSRGDFFTFIGAYGAFFALYASVLFFPRWRDAGQMHWIGLGIGLRALLLFGLPNFSDDFYRFLWDGHLLAGGVHPFAHPPVYFLQNPAAAPGLPLELFSRLNSPEYYSVYPPVCQAVFWLAVKIFPASVAGAVFVLKLFLFVCEVGTIFLLRHFGAPSRAALWYALNPLVIFEIIGNCHFEGAMLFFLLGGWYALQRERTAEAACWWAAAVASKLLPLLFLPALLLQLGWRRGLRFAGVFAVACGVFFLLLLDPATLAHIANSVGLYFHQFEFNASVYYVLKRVWSAFAPPTLDVARTLGPVLGGAVFLGVLVLAVSEKNRVPPRLRGESLLFPLALYLALATTVHPWYVVPLFGLSLLTRLRFPLVWTAAVALSYSHYAGGHFRENYLLIGLEYAAVALSAVWDWYRVSPSNSRPRNSLPGF